MNISTWWHEKLCPSGLCYLLCAISALIEIAQVCVPIRGKVIWLSEYGFPIPGRVMAEYDKPNYHLFSFCS